MMSRRTTWLVLVLAISIGAICATALYRYGASMTATTLFVVPAKEIAPYSIVTPDMVELRPFPEAMAQHEVYRSVDEVIGKLATTTLMPGQLLYVHDLAAPQRFRYTDDMRLEVVSFPVKPEQAAGAQLRPGQRINVYRPASQPNPIGDELLVADVRTAPDGYLVVTVGASPDIVRQLMNQSPVFGRDSLWITLAPITATAQAQP